MFHFKSPEACLSVFINLFSRGDKILLEQIDYDRYVFLGKITGYSLSEEDFTYTHLPGLKSILYHLGPLVVRRSKIVNSVIKVMQETQ